MNQMSTKHLNLLDTHLPTSTLTVVEINMKQGLPSEQQEEN
jgi:hypothetical protein